jgi:acetyl-CoA C-acetyltransferase
MCEDREVLILSACRTPIGRFLGSLKSVPAPDLAAAVLEQAVVKAGVAGTELEEIILGCAFPAGLGPAPAKQAARKAELPLTARGFVVSQNEGSGLQAVFLAAQAIRSEAQTIVAAGGMENMSRAPHLLAALREGSLFGDLTLRDGLAADGLWCAFGEIPMGRAAENAAKKLGIFRSAQDDYVLRSHRLASRAAKDEHLREGIVRVKVPLPEGGTRWFEADEGPRVDLTREKLAGYPSAFMKDGTVSAASASSFGDGAAALILASDEAVKAKGLKPLARVLVTAAASLDADAALEATAIAMEKAAADSGWKLGDVDLFEIQESFAVEPAAATKALKLDADRVNPNGGALALGDPVGASGARLVVALVGGLRRAGMKKGMAALCLAGGDALALTLEMV